MKTHIFMDNSNIFGGAQRTAESLEKAPWPSVRVDYGHLFRLLTHGKNKSQGVSMLAGSVPPGNEALWEAAKHAGFDTTLLKRVENDDGSLIEQGVDEAIHLKIANLLLDTENPEILIIATGDGKDTEQGSSFTQQVRRAAKRGWKVEIWSWDSQLSKRLRDTRLEFADQVTVFRLDKWYRSIVFLKGGTYDMQDGPKTVVTRTCEAFDFRDSTIAEAKIS